MRITRAHLMALRTDKGSYTRATTDALGVPYPWETGWQERLIGKEVDQATYDRAVAGRTVLMKSRKAQQPTEHSQRLAEDLKAIALDLAGLEESERDYSRRMVYGVLRERVADCLLRAERL